MPKTHPPRYYKTRRSRSRSRSRSYERDRDREHRHQRRKHDDCESSKSGSGNTLRSTKRFRETEDNDCAESGTSKPTSNQNFDIRANRYYFDRMFFRSTDLITKGSVPLYEDFWKFYDKIINIQKRAQGKTKPCSTNTKYTKISGIDFPEKYSKALTIPVRLKYTSPNDFIANLNPDDQDFVRENIPETILIEFIQILLYFIDFTQKEKFAKLKKLRETQAALPIAHYRNEIVTLLEKHNVLIIAGDTGCGKSTQVPQFLLKAGFTNIACTQPRRIACLSLCKRVAYETLNEYGSEVGYQIRFEKRKTQHTKVVFITEGLLLRQVTTDSLLESYNVIVLDEVHERHLHGDFLLGIMKCLLYQRENIKIILMSATINTELFQNYFQGLAPILQVPGRLYPIKLQYRPVSIEELNSKSSRLNPGPYIRILQLIDDKFPHDERGDVLIFLSGLNEITTVVDAAKIYAEQTKRWIILPLHSMLSIDDQDKAFDYPPEGVRKCIVSTNIAETSITIDGIRFVIDSGKVKEMAYDPNCRMQRLKEFWISKASAEQRKGRAGRTGPGICYRLFAETNYQEMQPYSTPEIQRVPLDSLLLQMIALGIPDCRKFPFIEAPAIESIESSIVRLKDQDALTETEELTPIGKTLSQLPVDVTIGKMLIMGTMFDQIDAVLSLASTLSVQSPFTNWAHRDQDCVAARKSLDSDHGDPLTLLNAYRAWLEEKSDPSANTRKWCKRRGFEEQRFYEMTKLRQQFQALLTDSRLINERQEAEAMNSSERAMRYGELKQLRTIKKEYHMAAPRKKKILKFQEDGVDAADHSDAEVGDDNIDIRDVEFRLRHDMKNVKALLQKSTPFGEDLLMLKVILCSGIYPQVGIADDFNKYKSDADQVYHTKGKGFTVLHPMSIFANQPGVLQLTDADIIVVPEMNTKLPISSKHQLLCFLNLLETNKPYLMNTFRMPAIQTLLLFAHNIDSDPGFTRFVFDSWLEVEFTDPMSAISLVVSAICLREKWNKLLKDRLTREDDVISAKDKRDGRELSTKLVQYLRSEVYYTIKRLLTADQKDLYNREFVAEYNTSDSQSGLKFSHNIGKGGLKITPFLTYGCLYGESPEPEKLVCQHCNVTLIESPLNLLIHQITCYKKSSESKIKEEQESLEARAFSKLYFCSECGKEYHLTPIEILKHKMQHRD